MQDDLEGSGDFFVVKYTNMLSRSCNKQKFGSSETIPGLEIIKYRPRPSKIEVILRALFISSLIISLLEVQKFFHIEKEHISASSALRR